MQEKTIDILELLPQKPPFVMVDLLVSSTETDTITELNVRNDNLFCVNGVLNEAGLIENIAQTCAARQGFINKFVHNEDVKLGFIGAIRGLEILRLPKINETITTTITIIEEIFNMILVKTEVKSGEELLAFGEMKIAEQ